MARRLVGTEKPSKELRKNYRARHPSFPGLVILAVLALCLEQIDNSTGRTTAVWVTKGFFELLPPRQPQ